MTQDNDPWGNNPRNTDTNELGAALGKLKDSLFGKGGQEQKPNGSSPSPQQSQNNFPKLPGKAIAPLLAVAFLGWVSTGIYILPEGFHGVELAFGKYSETATQAGFNLRKPFPIGSVTKVDVESLKTLSVGSNNDNSEGQMLTSDENIVETSLSVQYKIGNAEDYLFNVNNPELVMRESLISSIREVVGASGVDYVLTDGRTEWPARVRENLISTLDGFKVGLNILRVELSHAKAPAAVQDAFDDAVKAREDADRYKLQADAYRNKEVPLARGQAKQITEEAEAYKATVIAKATGEASRFNDVLETYRLAPQVTRDRMYLETLESVYKNVNNVVVATGNNPPIMYLPMGQNTQTPPVLPVAPENNFPVFEKSNSDASKEDDFKLPVIKTQKRLSR